MRRSIVTSAVLSLAAFVPISMCTAQTPEVDDEAADRSSHAARPSGDQGEAVAPLSKVHLNIVDQKLALSLAVDTQMQIEMGQLALESIRNDTLRRLLTARLDTQRAFVEQLETLTQDRAGEEIAQARRAIENDKASDGDDTKRFSLLALRRNATAMLVRIRVEILQKYGQMVCRELNAEHTDEFDRHYLQCDLLHQMQMLATLEVFADQASADFAQVIRREAVAATEQLHLTRQLALQLETLPLAGNSAGKPLVVETASEQ